MEVVIEQVQPHGIPLWHALRQRHQVRRDDLHILSSRLLRQGPGAADRIVVEMGDLGRHEAVDPSFGPDDCAMPPSIATSLAVIKLLSDDARKAATAPISEGSAMRCSGVIAAKSFWPFPH